MNKDFSIITRAKCILAGEHAVLNNFSLVAKAINSYELKLNYHQTHRPLHLETAGTSTLSNENLLMYFFALLKKAFHQLDKDFHAATGTFTIDTNIPIAAGLGFSAAICTAVTEWMSWQGFVEPENKFEYARSLEDMFHGKSSGADIAACMAKKIIIFKKPNLLTYFDPKWKPNIYISTTKVVSITSEAVHKVQVLRQQQSKLGESTDKKMGQAALQIIDGLQSESSVGLELIADAFSKARECFKVWELIPPEIEKQMNQLLQFGALAVKPTGAGNGGSILSLWKNPPPVALTKNLTAVF